MRAEQLSQVSLWLGWDRKKLRQGKLMLLHSYLLKPWKSKLKKKTQQKIGHIAPDGAVF